MAQLGIVVGLVILSFLASWELVGLQFILNVMNGAQLRKSDELFYSSIYVAGSKQALLVDAVKESSVCKIRSSSDVFCIEFGKKVRMFRVLPSSIRLSPFEVVRSFFHQIFVSFCF